MRLAIDDFATGAPDLAAWSVFTDRVMGGVSDAQSVLCEVRGRRALQLTGRVSLERNGGFAQMARTLGKHPSGTLDARGYTGIALSVCGTPGPYFVHLRTTDTRAPWQHYSAPLLVSDVWRDVWIGWSEFEPISLSLPLDTSHLARIGIVAAKQAFDANVAISWLGLSTFEMPALL